jgi:hypothetical protein
MRSTGSNQSREICIRPGFDFTQVIISKHLEKGKHYVGFRSLNIFKSQLVVQIKKHEKTYMSK